MQLITTKLHNICQHRDLEHTWSPRTNLIIGSNGVGKSNLLKAMKYVITGDFDNYGVKEENAYQLASVGSKSYIVQTLIHDGVDIEVIRYLKGGKSQIVVNGTRSIGENNVGEALKEILGVNTSIVDNYIFVGQGKIFDFIDERPAIRAQNFQQLFDMDAAEQLYKALGKAMDQVDLPPDPSEEFNGLTAHIEELKQSIATIDGSLVAYDDLRDFERESNYHVRRLAEHQEAVRLSREANEKDAERDKLIDQLGAALAAIDAATIDLRTITDAIQNVRDDVEVAKVTLANWKAHKRAQVRVREAQVVRDRILALANSHPQPMKPANYCDEATRNRRMTVIRPLLEEVENFIRTFNPQNGLTECPTCGMSTSKLDGKYEEFQITLPKLRADFDHLNGIIDISSHYESDLDAWERWKAGWDARIEAAETVLVAAMQAVNDEPEGMAEDYEEIVNAFAELEEAKLAADRAHCDACRDEERIRFDIARLQSEHNRLWMEVEGMMLLDPELDEAIVKVKEIDRRLQQYGELIGRKNELNVAWARDIGRVDSLARVIFHTAKLRAWFDYLSNLRGVVHRDGLPARVSRNYLTILADDVNNLLDQFEASFNVDVIDPLSFVAMFPDGRVQSAQRLSGGERVILALAFRVAVNSLFAESIGLLALDEPTQFLDEDHLASVKTAVARLRDLSDSRGLQCMLITHEPRLGNAFDSVLQLHAA